MKLSRILAPFQKIKNYGKTFTDVLFPTRAELQLMRITRTWKKLSDPRAEQVVLVQAIDPFAYIVRCYFFLKFYFEKKAAGPTRIIFLDVDTPRPVSSGLLPKMVRRLRSLRIFNWKTRKFYQPLGGEWGFSYVVQDPSPEQVALAETLFNSLKSKEDLEQLTHKGIWVGDLIYDTYLRYRPAPTVNLADPYIKELILWSIVMQKRVEDFISPLQVQALVTSYTSYLTHGLLVRICLRRQIETFALLALNAPVVSVDLDLPYHIRNYLDYKKRTTSGPERQDLISRGRQHLEIRFSGRNDPGTSYMVTSGFAKGTAYPWPEKKNPRVLVMGHDFFDSPHFYGPSLFPDFVEWLHFVFQEALKTPFEFYYKPHPNALPDNDDVVLALKEKFKNVHFLPKTVSNLDILKQGFDLTMTVHGTVAHEFPYCGVPVLSCGANEHRGFSFSLEATSRDDLANWIRNFPERLKGWQADKTEIEWFLGEHTLISPLEFKNLQLKGFEIQDAIRLLADGGKDYFPEFFKAYQISLDREKKEPLLAPKSEVNAARH